MLNFSMINWLKKNWSITLLVLISVLYLKQNFFGTKTFNLSSPVTKDAYYQDSVGMASPAEFRSILPKQESTPSSSPDRIVIQDTSFSLHVKDVSITIKSIEEKTKQLGGFLVNSHLSKPEQAASGSITIRVPTDKLDQAMESFRQMAIKIVSESVNGRDVTDQYEDLQARLAILNKTKIKFETIMDQATKVTDLLSVQRELVNLQSQIDNVKGRQDYLQKSADLSKITIYLSTDELSLPYAPSGTWRPVVIFKTAVRSLLSSLRDVANLAIWLAVYSPLIAIAVLVYRFIQKKRKKIS